MPPLLHRATVTALLSCAAVAQAQQQPMVRMRREQQLVLAQMPAGGEPELRVAPGVPTVVRFDAELVHAEVKQEGAGSSVSVDVAGHSFLIEAQRELESGERLPLEVVLVQGQTRTRLVFQLVSHPGAVDARVDVELRPRSGRSEPGLEAASPRREGSPFSRMVFSGVMGESGVTASVFAGKAIGSGVLAKPPREYRAERGRAIVFHVHNPAGARPWLAAEVVQLSSTGERREGAGSWTVSMEGPIAPGDSGRVVLESAGDGANAPVLLEVREEGGIRGVRVEESR
ncbi:DUF2381 family protein [Archangium violaceum]|uniref:DUF2381 family protein n=1 Tax=Archangium violaceum TaxID=83451 RepID=UPI0036D8468C